MSRKARIAAMLLFLIPALSPAQGVPALEALESLKAEMSFDPITGRGRISRGEASVEYLEGSRTVLLSDSLKAEVDTPYRSEDGILRFPAAFIDLARTHFQAQPEKQRFSVAAIIIDPGHGGKDPGAIAEHGSGKNRIRVVEKDINLKVSLMLYERLKKAFPEKKILATRTTDVYPELSERTDMANAIPLAKNEAIIFISIHTNASLSKKARGFEVWYLDPEVRRPHLAVPGGADSDPALHPILADMLQEEFTTESIIIAKNILESMDEAVGELTENRGIKDKDWYVVKNARMPAVLVELSYLSNETDARLLARDDYLKKLADAIYTGIVSFVRYFDTSKGFTE